MADTKVYLEHAASKLREWSEPSRLEFEKQLSQEHQDEANRLRDKHATTILSGVAMEGRTRQAYAGLGDSVRAIDGANAFVIDGKPVDPVTALESKGYGLKVGLNLTSGEFMFESPRDAWAKANGYEPDEASTVGFMNSEFGNALKNAPAYKQTIDNYERYIGNKSARRHFGIAAKHLMTTKVQQPSLDVLSAPDKAGDLDVFDASWDVVRNAPDVMMMVPDAIKRGTKESLGTIQTAMDAVRDGGDIDEIAATLQSEFNINSSGQVRLLTSLISDAAQSNRFSDEPSDFARYYQQTAGETYGTAQSVYDMYQLMNLGVNVRNGRFTISY